ncbi:ChbG/HpnK family deacetylase [Enterococcus casseliflavus]|uniref:ChbG/HpnK family deacetylase n=1 Tax=Enterococcus casseliflavus TaxID=37734 RepID=UPI003D144D40
MTKKMIVRADDLGYSEAVNLGIAKSINEGIVNNVGVMVNMPSVESGLELIKRKDIDYGCHTVICSGKPITDPIKIPSITTEDGNFKPSSDYRNAKEDFVVYEEVLLEVEAQYQRFVDLIGKKPDYFEGHAVQSKNFFKALTTIAERHDISDLKFDFEKNTVSFNNQPLYASFDFSLENYQPLDTLKELAKQNHSSGYSMMVCHPGYIDQYLLDNSSLIFPRVKEVEMLCSNETKDWLKKNSIELIRYSEI